MKSEMPQDPVMLMSFVNMRLRDNHLSLDEFCDDMDIKREDLERKMAEVGFEYNPDANKFW